MRKIGFTQPVETQAEPVSEAVEQGASETVKKKRTKEKPPEEETKSC